MLPWPQTPDLACLNFPLAFCCYKELMAYSLWCLGLDEPPASYLELKHRDGHRQQAIKSPSAHPGVR